MFSVKRKEMLLACFLAAPPPLWRECCWAGRAGTNIQNTLEIHLAKKNTPTMWQHNLDVAFINSSNRNNLHQACPNDAYRRMLEQFHLSMLQHEGNGPNTHSHLENANSTEGDSPSHPNGQTTYLKHWSACRAAGNEHFPGLGPLSLLGFEAGSRHCPVAIFNSKRPSLWIRGLSARKISAAPHDLIRPDSTFLCHKIVRSESLELIPPFAAFRLFFVTTPALTGS